MPSNLRVTNPLLPFPFADPFNCIAVHSGVQVMTSPRILPLKVVTSRNPPGAARPRHDLGYRCAASLCRLSFAWRHGVSVPLTHNNRARCAAGLAPSISCTHGVRKQAKTEKETQDMCIADSLRPLGTLLLAVRLAERGAVRRACPCVLFASTDIDTDAWSTLVLPDRRWHRSGSWSDLAGRCKTSVFRTRYTH